MEVLIQAIYAYEGLIYLIPGTGSCKDTKRREIQLNEAKDASNVKRSPLSVTATIDNHTRYNTARIAVHATVILPFCRAGKSFIP